MQDSTNLLPELWNCWQLACGDLGGWVIEEIYETLGEFTILLCRNDEPRKKSMKICFGDAVSAHRLIARRIADPILIPALEQFGVDVFKKYTFFKVVNSRYVQDFVDESGGFVTQDWFTHFVFVGEDFVLDVAACEEPVVEISGRALEVDEDAVL